MMESIELLMLVLIVIAALCLISTTYWVYVELQYKKVQKKIWILTQLGYKFKPTRPMTYPAGADDDDGDYGMWVSEEGGKIITEHVFNDLSCRKLKELAEDGS